MSRYDTMDFSISVNYTEAIVYGIETHGTNKQIPQ